MSKQTLTSIKLLSQFALSLPLFWLLYLLLTQQLGADPAEQLVRDLGFIGACVLWLSLGMTPLRLLSGWPGWIGLRRLVGLWSFSYLSLHLLAFVVFWAGLDPDVIWEEVSQRPYIVVGLLGWLLMLPLALTSTRKSRVRLGRNWVRLHKLVYLVAVFGLVHIVWIAKLEYRQPLAFAVVLLLLFAIRIHHKNKFSPVKTPSKLAQPPQ